jgi:DNA repair protein RadC
MADSFRLKDQPAGERPRERLVARGPDALTHAELIAILLRTGLRGANVVQVAQNILQKFGSLNALALARRMEQERREESPVLDNPATVVSFMRETNRLLNVDSFQVLLLNTRKKLIRSEEISQGLLDTILVHPREVFRAAIVANAAGIVLVHSLCAATHKECYVERRFMWSRWAQAFIGQGFFVVLLPSDCT